MKRFLLISALLGLMPILSYANIAVTEGSGKTVSTTSDQSLEFQNVVISTIMVNDNAGVPKSLGYATGNSSMPVAPAPGATFPISGSISNTSFTSTQGTAGTQDWPVRVSTVALQTGTNSIGTVQIGNTPNTTDIRVTMSTNTVSQGSAGTTDWPVRISTVVVNQGTPGVTDWRVTMGTNTVGQGTAGTQDWPVRVTSAVVNSGTTFLKIELSTGVRVNTTGGNNLGIDLSTGAQVNGALADNGVAAATNRVGVVPSIYQTSYLNGTAATQGRNGALSQGTDGLLWTAQLPAIRPASFSASTNSITLAAGATHVACIQGNASNIVLVYGMRASCTQTTAGIITFNVMKSTTAFTGVWSTMTVIAHDTSVAVQVSSAVFFNNAVANTTMNTEYYLDVSALGCMATGTAAPNDVYISPPSWRMKPIVLRGVAQSVCANFAKRTVTGGLLNVGFDWIETTTISP